MRALWLGAALGLAACHDFDAAPQLCLANGVCRSNIDQDAGTFALAPAPASVTLGPGGAALVGLALTRPKNRFDALTLTISGPGADAGLALRLSTNDTQDSEVTLSVRVPLPFPAGAYPLHVAAARAGTEVVAEADLPVTVRPPATTLLVDDDESPNNGPNPFSAVPSAEDAFYRSRLGGFDDVALGPPLTPAQLAGYASVVWYTGKSDGPSVNLTTADRALLLQWLDLGGKKLLLVSQNFPSDVGSGWSNATDPLLRDAIGAAGSLFFSGMPVVVRGVVGEGTEGVVLDVRANDPLPLHVAVLNARPGTRALLTTPAKPPGGDGGVQDLPVATLRTGVGDAGTSTVAFVGFPFVNATDGGSGTFDAVRSAAGIP